MENSNYKTNLAHTKLLLNNALKFNLELQIEVRVLKDVPKPKSDQLMDTDGSIYFSEANISLTKEQLLSLEIIQSCAETDGKFISVLINCLFTEEELMSGVSISGRASNNTNYSKRTTKAIPVTMLKFINGKLFKKKTIL